MNYTFKLSRRAAHLRTVSVAALLLAIAACNTSETLEPTGDIESVVVTEGADKASLATAVPLTGIPFGYFHLPTTSFGTVYNGALRNISPWEVLKELAAIKARGGRVMLTLVGNDKYFLDANHHFSLTKWKARVDRFRSVNLTPYINDGTIIGHYMLDEPNDPSNWNGQTVSGATLDEMARYSKSIWPNMMTIVRTDPAYLNGWTGNYAYLDAAWAQYVARKGDINLYLTKLVTLAKKKGLALVVGMNTSMGSLSGGPLTASQITTWGSVLLNDPYPCAFLSWQYDAGYAGRTDIKNAMTLLRDKAKRHVAKTCRGS